MSKFGIDVSAWNTTIDWNKVKSQIDFAIIKLGNIGDNNKFWKDKYFERNYKECARLGIPIGVYVYSYTNQIENIDDCARAVVDNLKGKKLQLPVYIDIEDKEIAPEGKAKLTEMVITFNTIIEKAGFWAGVYANKNWFNNYLNKENIKKKYTTWIATYASGKDMYKGEYDMWQNSSKGKINGIKGNVDTNYMYRDLMSEIGNTKQSDTKKTTTIKTVSITDLAKEVIDGKWGTGEARKKALGSLYSEVQAKVNEIMKAKETKKEITYKVQKGDTLSAIAKKYNTTVEAIAKKNNIKDVNKIYVGQSLKI